MPSADIIEAHLRLATGQDGMQLISPEECRRRAVAILEEVDALRFPLVLQPWTSPHQNGPVPYPAYQINDPRYHLETGPGARGQFAILGPDISCGDLVKLGRVCLLRREFFPRGWPRGLKDQFLDPQSHLDAVEEFSWLRRWRGLTNVRREVLAGSKGSKNADLGFHSCLVPIAVEIKNRRREAVGVIDGWHSSRDYDSLFKDLIGKFSGARPNNELHVACISTHLEPDDALSAQARDFLAKHPELDAIVVWSDHCRDDRNFREVYGEAKNRQQVELLLAEPEREEAQRWFVIKHLARNSDTGTVLQPSEIAEWIRRNASR